MIVYEIIIVFFILLSLKPLWRQLPKLYRLLRYGYKKYRLWDDIRMLEQYGHTINIKSNPVGEYKIMYCAICDSSFVKSWGGLLILTLPPMRSPGRPARYRQEYALEHNCTELVIRDII